MLPGLVPDIPPGSLLSIMALMGSVGSSLNLLLYSIWLKEKAGEEEGAAFYRKAIWGVNLDLILAFLFVGIITVLFISLGVTGFSISYLAHGETFSIDALISQVLYVIASIPYGPQTFLATGYLIMFGAVLTGMDGRARAISEILHTGFAIKWDEKTTFRLILLLFTTIIVTGVIIGEPVALIHGVSAIASVSLAVAWANSTSSRTAQSPLDYHNGHRQYRISSDGTLHGRRNHPVRSATCRTYDCRRLRGLYLRRHHSLP